MKKQTKRDLKIAGIALAVGLVLGAWVMHPSPKHSAISTMRETVRATNADTDAWLADIDRELSQSR